MQVKCNEIKILRDNNVQLWLVRKEVGGKQVQAGWLNFGYFLVLWICVSSIYFVLYVVGVREDKEVERKAGKSAVEQSCRLRLSQLSSSKKVLGSADCWWNKSLTFTKSTQTPPVCQLRSSAKGHKWEKGGTRRIIWGISGTKKDFSRLKATRGAGGENSLQLQWDRDPGAWHNNKIQDDLDMCVETNLFVHSTVIQSVPMNVTENNQLLFSEGLRGIV